MKGLWHRQPNDRFKERGHTFNEGMSPITEKIVLFGAAGAIQGNSIHPYIRFLLHRSGAQNIRPLPLINGVLCTLPEKKTVAMLARNANIFSLEDNSTVRLLPVFHESDRFRPNDRGVQTTALKFERGRQLIPWGVARIGANRVWGQSRGTGVKIAVIDTGIDSSHPDLADNVRAGINLINPTLPPKDDYGHGTHVAGIIAAVDNDAGVIGVAPAVHLYPVKALNWRGEGTLADVLQALDWCVKQRMDVINMSFGIDTPSQALHTAIRRAVQAGCVIVAAAGNDGRSQTVDYPAAYNEVIAVGAADEHDRLAWFSSRGPEVKLVAPGTGVLSTATGNNYLRLDGTSMAAAHVSGAIALLLQVIKRTRPGTALQYLLNSVEVLPGLSAEEKGVGLIKVDRALAQLGGNVGHRAHVTSISKF